MRYAASFFILMSLFAPASVFADPAIEVTVDLKRGAGDKEER